MGAGNSVSVAQREMKPMAFEARGTRRYYYRGRRIGDRVVKEYCGNGERAKAAAEADRRDRDQRRLQADANRREQGQMEEVLAALDEFCEASDKLLASALLKTGCRFHRGEWRRKHGSRAV